MLWIFPIGAAVIFSGLTLALCSYDLCCKPPPQPPPSEHLPMMQQPMVVAGLPAPALITVIVPEGAAAGQLIEVDVGGGQRVQVAVPAGLAAGQSFQIQAPGAAGK